MLWKALSAVALSWPALIMFTSSPLRRFLVLNLPFTIEFLTLQLQSAPMSIYPDWHMTHYVWCVLLRFIPRIGWHSWAICLDMMIPYNTTLHLCRQAVIGKFEAQPGLGDPDYTGQSPQ